ncbi:MAG TPA: hypothetical protein EYO51_00270 [Methylococcaceae bacterium]|jgi:hypothetical protein|nr:hypothetical protein [Methylococcaceae bacterium]HIN67740.1 hypothetical protein [Methylococcales bacterium]HIA45776.1 hypothetical protein [Methylococcaceae bacterium]HIB61599.1 hypothetical protein [Methylococcaceae bacterium]HIO12178.1 hypothetical protein [Methylococcales bacterium]
MEKIKLATGLITALLITSPIMAAEEYPAYNFKPIIVYQDKAAISQAKTVVAKAAPAAVKKDESTSVTELGLLVAIAGAIFFLVKGRSGSAPKAASGTTGVDRYVEAQGGADSGSSRVRTGVDRYLNG